MPGRRKFTLSRLREIGWNLWDPIGLKCHTERPKGDYDTYLLQAAGKLWSGASEEEVLAYFVSVELNDLCAGRRASAEERARRTVRALSQYGSELRG